MLRPLLLLMLNYPERFGSASGRMIPERILRFRIRFTDLLIMHHVKIFQLKISCVKQKHVRFPVCVGFLIVFSSQQEIFWECRDRIQCQPSVKNLITLNNKYIPSPVPPPPLSPFPLFPLPGEKTLSFFRPRASGWQAVLRSWSFLAGSGSFLAGSGSFFYVPPAPTHGSKFLSLISLKKTLFGAVKSLSHPN